MSEETLKRLAKYRAALPEFTRDVLKVRDKGEQIVPLVLNDAQWIIHEALETQKREKGWVRALILKSRQQGSSTYIAARFYHRTALHRGVNTYILAHEQGASDALFSIVDRYQRNSPIAPHVGKSNVKELEFDRLDSSYVVATAGQKAGGRGRSVSLFHGCLSPDSWVITPSDEPRRMAEFRVGDLVRTHTGAAAAVSFISHNMAPVIRIKVLGANESIIATPGHRFLTGRGKMALRDLRVGDQLCYPVSILGNSAVSWPYRLDYGRRPGRGGTGSVGPGKLLADYAVGRVLGLYLAEGCLLKQSNGGALSGVCFVVHEREVARTLDWLAPLRACWRSAPAVAPRGGSKAVAVTVYSRSFAEFIRARCGELDDKRFPVEWRDNVDFAHGIIVGYFAGDGGGQFNTTTRRVQASSIRGAISFAARDALAALGYGWASVVYRPAALRRERNERAQWTVRLAGVGADRLWEEMGRAPYPRTRSARQPNFEFRDGCAWFPITALEDGGAAPVMDFEVDHPDHSYCIWQAATSNSEVAFWPNAKDHFAASVQTVPLFPGTEIVLESTANGPGGEFYERWHDAEAGRGDYIPIFVPWFVSKEYQREPEPEFTLESEAPADYMSEVEYAETFGLTMPQMAWRRAKIDELRSEELFRQEYPATPGEAWVTAGMSSFISSLFVLRARKRKLEARGPLILGVDPASMGGDRFSVAARRGHAVLWVEHRSKIDSLEGIAWVRALIEKHDPARVNIDAGNIGHAIIGGLRSIGPKFVEKVRGINFGGTSEHKLAKPKVPGPANRRAEMWGRLLDWLQAPEGASLPDMDALQSDLCAPRLKPKLNNDFLLESKEEMKRRGVRSPDLADAVALTFALNEYHKNYSDAPTEQTFGNLDTPRSSSVVLPAEHRGPLSWMS